ncbi:hypothetical protein NKI51_04475 [Mesorhizobium australicum]|jgi:hypothetical protein|uniref:Uncharacterized protein n=1 Tax=Mesorhizobium australicum TaxID=536018 RepID=A0ACC6SSA2_9HYPH|nr:MULTISPECIES: hypothetical protein [unclassified Mesorhizobium]
MKPRGPRRHAGIVVPKKAVSKTNHVSVPMIFLSVAAKFFTWLGRSQAPPSNGVASGRLPRDGSAGHLRRARGSYFFASVDVLRLPLGVLTGVGFIGGDAILRRGDL